MAALVFLSGPSAGVRYEVTGETTIGRSRTCEIALDDDKVSRRHARIVLVHDEARVRDLGSRNGTRVNGHRIASEIVLLTGDRLQVGDTTLRFEPSKFPELVELEPKEARRWSVDSVLAETGRDGDLHRVCGQLLGASNEAIVLRRAAERLAEMLRAPRATALTIGASGFRIAAVVGASVDAPRALIQGALDRNEIAQAGRIVAIPLRSADDARFGALCAAREGELSADEVRWSAVLGRLAGEAVAASRERARSEPPIPVGTAPAFRRAVEKAGRLAAGDKAVSIFGDPGSGRNLMARYVHAHSARSLGPLIAVNCADAESADEDLFGLAAGLESALARADGGTLVLRQIEFLRRPAAQRLARFLLLKMAPAKDGERPVDVRTIALGREPLEVLAAQRRIPQELAKALPAAKLELPSLRERSSDVPTLFKFFANEVSRLFGSEPPRLSPDAKRALMAYGWPGNVRELRLISERLALLYPGLEVPAIRLPPEVLEPTAVAGIQTLHQRVIALERDAIVEALRQAGGKKIRAAEILGVSRPTLDKKLRDLHLIARTSARDGE